MWSYVLIACAAILFGGYAVRAQEHVNTNIQTNEATSFAGSMRIYGVYVNAYAVANPTASGAIADSALGLPAWFNRLNTIQNYVESGKGYVYIPNSNSDLAYRLVKQGGHTTHAGIKVGGNLINPLSKTNYTSPYPLPSSIPDGSVVIAP